MARSSIAADWPMPVGTKEEFVASPDQPNTGSLLAVPAREAIGVSRRTVLKGAAVCTLGLLPSSARPAPLSASGVSKAELAMNWGAYEGNALTLADFGLRSGTSSGAEAANRRALQDAFDAAAAEGRLLNGIAGVFRFDAPLLIPDGLRFNGKSTCRLEKAFTTFGQGAGLRPNGTANDVLLLNFEVGSVAHTINGVATNKVLVADGDDWFCQGIKVRTWSGFGYVTRGTGHVHRDILLEDPWSAPPREVRGNSDGVHMVGGSNHLYENLQGTSGDDFLAIATPRTGANANEDISDVTIRGVNGRSLHARLLMIGSWDRRLTARVSNVTASRVYGSGRAPNAGAISIINVGGLGEDISVTDFDVSGEGAAHSALRIAGGRNIAITGGKLAGGRVHAIHVLATPFENLSVAAEVDATASNSFAVNVAPAGEGIGLSLDLDVVAGPSRRVVTVAGARASSVDRANIALRVRNMPSDSAALSVSNLRRSRIRLSAQSRPGALNTTGLAEGPGLVGVELEQGDLVGISRAVGSSIGAER
jgi:hypothetical protein